jgi:hypothetical protein
MGPGLAFPLLASSAAAFTGSASESQDSDRARRWNSEVMRECASAYGRCRALSRSLHTIHRNGRHNSRPEKRLQGRAIEQSEILQDSAMPGDGRPRVGSGEGLRATRQLDQLIKGLGEHRPECVSDVPGLADENLTAPNRLGHALRGPISWRIQGSRQSSVTPPSS